MPPRVSGKDPERGLVQGRVPPVEHAIEVSAAPPRRQVEVDGEHACDGAQRRGRDLFKVTTVDP
jgi:hypothetical protein